MKRRELIKWVFGAAAMWPLATRAQQQRPTPVIGLLSIASPACFANLVAALRQGLQRTGYVEGQNLDIEFRCAEGHFDRLAPLAADLVNRQVAVVVATGGPAPALAAKAMTSTIPIVFNVGADPVKLGLVASFNRPGGNVMGVSFFVAEPDSKRLGLLLDLVPGIRQTLCCSIQKSECGTTVERHNQGRGHPGTSDHRSACCHCGRPGHGARQLAERGYRSAISRRRRVFQQPPRPDRRAGRGGWGSRRSTKCESLSLRAA